MRRHVSKNLFRLGASLLFIGFFSINLLVVCDIIMPVEMPHANKMVVICPFADGVETLCPIDLLNHILSWENKLFAAQPADTGIVLLGFVLATLAYIYLNVGAFILRITNYTKDNPEFKIYNFISILFSRGLLNSRLFAK